MYSREESFGSYVRKEYKDKKVIPSIVFEINRAFPGDSETAIKVLQKINQEEREDEDEKVI